ncbi:MAG: hypothetical protein LBR66_09855 [Candidatus Symbiothrix sp.]|jgi:hypothetical protein|nr:hypothetical protein [Candidatus Symbiothrix sp.]
MYKKFTQQSSNEQICAGIETPHFPSFSLQPRKETVAFVMQYACAYYVEKQLPRGLSGMIIN